MPPPQTTTLEDAASPARTDSERSDIIVRAANELLASDGLEGLTIRSVLSRTGLARRAFYECFQGKDDLVLAIFEDSLREAGRRLGALADMAGSPLEGLRIIVQGIVMGQLQSEGIEDASFGSGHGRRSAALSREHLRLAESRPAELDAALRPLIDAMAHQVEKGIARGQFRPCDPRQHSAFIYNLLSTTVHAELLSAEDYEPDPERCRALADNVWDFCRRASIADPL